MADPPEDFLEDDYEEPPRPKRWPIFVAALVVVALIVTYAASELISSEIVPRLQSRGDPEAFEFLRHDPKSGGPVRYNPCEPLHYVINPEGAPEGGVQDVKDGIALVSEVTGIEFVYDGTSREKLDADRAIYQPSRYGREQWAPIILGWVPKEDLLLKNRHAIGAGGSAAAKNGTGNLVYVSGIVTFNGDLAIPTGYGPGRTWGDVVLHEMGHVLGLDHVDDELQLMFPNITSGPARLGSGDEAGFKKVGRDAGCLTALSPIELNESFHYAFIGNRLSMRVEWIPSRHPDCTVHSFQRLGLGLARGAVLSECGSWSELDPLTLIRVAITNKSKKRVAYKLDNFFTGAGTRYFLPVNVRSLAADPNAFFSKNGILKPGQREIGWVAFRTREGFVPKFISYSDGEDVMTVTFDGDPEVTRP